jgi:hypothetical protein
VKNRAGFSISNYLNTLEFENLLVKQQLGLYLNYIAFFHISQQKQLKRLLHKLEEFDADIEDNLNENGMCSIDDIENAEPIEDFFKMDGETVISQYKSENNLNTIEQIKIEIVDEVNVDVIPTENK